MALRIMNAARSTSGLFIVCTTTRRNSVPEMSESIRCGRSVDLSGAGSTTMSDNEDNHNISVSTIPAAIAGSWERLPCHVGVVNVPVQVAHYHAPMLACTRKGAAWSTAQL